MSGGKFPSDRFIEWIVFQFIQPFTNDSNSRNNQSYGFKNSQMDMRGCVWVGQSFLRNDKWQDNIIEWIFLQFTFNLLWMTQIQKIKKIHKWIMCMNRGKFLNEWQV